MLAPDILRLLLNATPVANLADNASSSPLTQFWLSLHTADPGEAGNQTTSEATYTSYARIAVVRTTSGWIVLGKQGVPTSKLSFPRCTGGSETLTHWAIGVAQTGSGAHFYSAPLPSPVAVSAGIRPTISAYSPVVHGNALLGFAADDTNIVTTTGHGGYSNTRLASFKNLALGNVVSQATDASKPGYTTSGINAGPSLSFHGAQHLLLTDSAIVTAMSNSNPVTLMYVANAGSSRDQQGTVFAAANSGFAATRFRSYSYTNTGSGGYRYQSRNDAGAATDTDEVTAGADNNTHVFEWFHGAGTVSLLVDGVTFINAAANDPGTTTPNQAAIGALPLSTLADFWTNAAQLSDLWLFNGDVGATQRGVVRTFLAAKRGLTVV